METDTTEVKLRQENARKAKEAADKFFPNEHNGNKLRRGFTGPHVDPLGSIPIIKMNYGTLKYCGIWGVQFTWFQK
jgi:hypothetical protein